MSFYAVAVGRRVGIYKNWSEAIKQVYQYSACSLKKFSTYQEAEYFLRRHQWQPPLTSTKDFKNISDKKDNFSDTASETDWSCSDPEDDDEDVAEATKKRGRDQEKYTIEELSVECPPSQRRKLDQNLSEQQDEICAFVASYQEDSTVGISCVFPDHPDWNVARKLDDADMTSSHARFAAALEAVKRVVLEDPNYDTGVTILTVDRFLVATMEECETSGWNAALSEDQGLVKRILDEKIGHRINWVHLNDDTMDSMNWAPKWSDLAYRKAFEAA